MVKKKHKTYSLEDLHEGNTRMVDPNVIPDKDKFDDEIEHGIDRSKHVGEKGTGRRWTIDTFKQSKGEHKTPPMISKIREIIKEVFVDLRS